MGGRNPWQEHPSPSCPHRVPSDGELGTSPSRVEGAQHRRPPAASPLHTLAKVCPSPPQGDASPPSILQICEDSPPQERFCTPQDFTGAQSSSKRGPRPTKPLPAPPKPATISNPGRFYKAPPGGFAGTGVTVRRYERARPSHPAQGHRTSSQAVQEITLLNPMVLDRRPRRDMPVGAGSVGSRS